MDQDMRNVRGDGLHGKETKYGVRWWRFANSMEYVPRGGCFTSLRP